MRKDNKHVYHGSIWAEYEDLLIGNKEGLEALRDAIDEALQKGESKNEVGEFYGVRCLDTDFFEKILSYKQNSNTLGSYIGFFIIVIAFFLTVLMVVLSKYG